VSRAFADASVIVYPTAPNLVAESKKLRDEMRALRRCLVPLPDDTQTGGAPILDAAAILAAHDSGEHRITIGPCPHAVPGDPLCDACLAVALPKP